MKRRYFKCTFLTDVILNAYSATEGLSESLDFIPGSNFLGIVAQKYSEYNDNAYEIFHSGKVVFGDAHLAIKGIRSNKRPASWFYEKTDIEQSKVYLHHFISDDQWTELTKAGKQLKQIRSDFFVLSDNLIVTTKAEHTYSLKSSYDYEKRRAEDEKLFGYDSLNKSSEWIFYVQAEDTFLDIIEKDLTGERSIGRSKTAQYGRVMIEKLPEHEEVLGLEPNTIRIGNINYIFLYFDSCGVFLDKYHQPTYQPEIQDLGFHQSDEISICWEMSQILTKTYSPWNKKRKNRDSDRVCINKGSVLVVKVPENFDLIRYRQKVSEGIGLYRNEGLGQVIVNPLFLTKCNAEALLSFDIVKQDRDLDVSKKFQYIVEKGDSDKSIINRLTNLSVEKKHQFRVLEKVLGFVKGNPDMKKISPSQWGQVRNLAMQSVSFSDLELKLFDKDNKQPLNGGFLKRGKAEEQWRGKTDRLLNSIEDPDLPEEYKIQYVINLASEMAKRDDKGGK
jgi:hypothetical protein